MTTPTQEFVDKYKGIERETDSEGRNFGFRRVRLSERVKLDEWFPELRDRALVLIASSCCEFEGTKVPFPQNRDEVEFALDRLDDPGIAAGTKALAKIYGIKKDALENTGEDEELPAKK